MSEPLPRVSGRTGQPIALNVRFFRNGVAADPFAIRRVKIYRSAVADENLIAEIPFLFPGEEDYPSPAVQDLDSDGDPIPGAFTLIFEVPNTGIPTPDIFFDVWEFIADDCTATGDGDAGTDGPSLADPCLDDEDLFISQCCQFWLFPDGFFLDCGLEVIRLGFEALDLKLHQPECRTIEVGMMPLPLYDFNFNLLAPIIPLLKAKFFLFTEDNELLIDGEPMTIGLRQGSFRSNPFTLQFKFNSLLITSTGCPLLRGTYNYQVVVELPNGETRASPRFVLQIS